VIGLQRSFFHHGQGHGGSSCVVVSQL
jgi:hypothetical protein